MNLPPALEDAARSCSAPATAGLLFERLVDEAAGGTVQASGVERLENDPALARLVAIVAAASNSLARLVLTDPAALDVLAGVANRSESPMALTDPGLGRDAADVARRKRLGLLRISARDLAGLDALEAVGEALSRLADAVLSAACRLSGVGTDAGLAVIAMGKHGAKELNYASDVDVMLVGKDESGAARRVLAVAGEAFRIDTDLRPEGRNGALVRSLASFEAYWERWARPWEFQALLKARPCAGDAELGTRFARAVEHVLWNRRLDADDLSELRAMKSRSEQITSGRGLAEREVKRGRGGIRDIEFSVQLLQLVHGPADAGIRVPATLPALAELADAGYVDGGDAAALSLAYRFLRTVEHRLQLVEEAQVHTIPEDRGRRAALAAGLGLAGTGRTRGRHVMEFDSVLAHYQSSARAIHERLFFRPLLEAFTENRGPAADRSPSGAPGREGGGTALRAPGGALARPAPGGALDARLQAFGFRQAERTRQALAELTRGLTRSSRLMQQMLPVLLGWLSESADPDQGLLALRTFASVPHRRDVLVAGFRDSPELARRLCLLVGTGRQVSDLVGRHPDVALRIGNDDELVPVETRELRERAVFAAEHDLVRAPAALRHFVEAETLRLAAGEILGSSSSETTARALASLADSVIEAALHVVQPKVPLAVVALGRLGGEELAFGSDLDVLLAYEGRGAADAETAEAAASAIFRLLNGATPADRILTLDASLRPEGKQGPRARSLAAYAEYYSRWAETWERQALLRVRPIAGETAVLEAFRQLADTALWGLPFGQEQEREIRRMKARIERERIPAGEDPQFHFKLGKGSLSDVEWTTQLLQLQHQVPGANTLAALSDLRAAGHLPAAEAAALSEAYRFLTRTRTRWHLVGNFIAGAGGIVARAGSDSLPTSREALGALARSLGATPADLREAYRRVTRRARRVTEARFYGL